MSTDYRDLTKELMTYLGKMNQDMPETMKAFGGLSSAATKEGSLDKKTKELIALGIAISTRCAGCIGFHVQKLVQYGTSKDEFFETLSMAVYMGGGPSLMYAAEALKAFEQFSE